MLALGASLAVLVGTLLVATLLGWDPATRELLPSTVVAAEAAVTPSDPEPAGSGSFTVGALAAGEVDRARFDAFWHDVVEQLADAPCPPAAGGAGTVVVLDVGATPPSELLAAGWTDWAPRLQAARATAAAACGT